MQIGGAAPSSTEESGNRIRPLPCHPPGGEAGAARILFPAPRKARDVPNRLQERCCAGRKDEIGGRNGSGATAAID